jgi:aspartate racemase
MHIGLVGGIGPAATIAYYDRLTRLLRDAGRPLELTIVQADSRKMIANLLADRREERAAACATLIRPIVTGGIPV